VAAVGFRSLPQCFHVGGDPLGFAAVSDLVPVRLGVPCQAAVYPFDKGVRVGGLVPCAGAEAEHQPPQLEGALVVLRLIVIGVRRASVILMLLWARWLIL